MKNQKTFDKLAAAVEELLGELQEEHGPEVQELRERVEEALAVAKHANGGRSRKVGARIGQYATSVDEYITDYPRLAFVTGAVIFATLGYVKGVTARAKV